MSVATAHVIVRTSCAHCHGAVELECKGLTGFWGYASYYEYLCPHCGKQNHERTTGTIVAARAVLGVEDARAAAHEPRRQANWRAG
jgi:hypothetical protein